MQAILRDLGIEEYIEENSAPPVEKAPPTEAEIKVQKEWKTGDAKAWTWIKLVIGDAEMIHISSTMRNVEAINDGKRIKGTLGSISNMLSTVQGHS